jgi:hypothetical protein
MYVNVVQGRNRKPRIRISSEPETALHCSGAIRPQTRMTARGSDEEQHDACDDRPPTRLRG